MTTVSAPLLPDDTWPVPLVPVGDVRVVPAVDWDQVIARLGGRDTYTSSAYHAVSALLEPPGTRPVLLHHRAAGGEVALPLLLRPLPGGEGWDALSAYGYGGPVSRGGRRVPGLGAALDSWARVNGVVATFLRLHPLLGNAGAVPSGAELVPVGSTVAWDVSAGQDLAAGMHPHHRRAARRADRAGLTVDVVRRPASLAEFRALYEVTMRRQSADPFFYFPQAYWDALLEAGDALEPVLVEGRLDGELVAALLCFRAGRRLHYHLGASADVARTLGASNRCFLAAATWGQAEGVSVFHLGGGLGGSPDSPLFVFKHRFAPADEPLPFHVAKLVHDRERYRELAGTDSTAGFFPPWRRGD
ncbi:GNAT family N-acetyltransferase [Modestobacter italicus]|uniref:GNAT family N-acetyltransferase n=1 Tax=Modestobacter italicus (strain DSM 44449 / CECT 9708 / BC 501) TaxID=2732864 RepID=UPI001C978248|nr:GNAT family N-acetyltransferase [Modestobacter italicus]